MPQANREADGAAIVMDNERERFQVKPLDELGEVLSMRLRSVGKVSRAV
jgi:hypothetical protein